ncbi:MAG: DNA polymerase I [Deferribacteraceae bacterium]|jgi:DNA polymerase-1|nr:DNA polymerase I [Deferribacteraceae bacterium]
MIAILDGNSIAYRAFHKAPPLTSPEGRPTGTVHIFFTILEKLEKDLKPTEIIAVFDSKGKTERHNLYPEYKANRDQMPEDLASQLELIRTLLPLAGIKTYAKEGVEADDIIASLAGNTLDKVAIVTKDKDLFQLIDERVKVYDDQNGELLGSAETVLKYGVSPQQMLDYLSLLGDKSDNIPGVAGVGEKTAAKLITEYGSLDGVYSHIEELKGKLKENLENDRQLAYKARSLIKLKESAIDFEPAAGRDEQRLRELLYKLGMRVAAQKLLTKETAEPLPEEKDKKLRLSGEVKAPIFCMALDGAAYVADENFYETLKVHHTISKDALFYDLKEILKLTGNFYEGRDCLLISWLTEPDNGTIYKGKNESLEEFIARIMKHASRLNTTLETLKLSRLYFDAELPLARILAKMEFNGIALDPVSVRETAKQLKKKLAAVATKIITSAGYDLNINSPKQLSEFLYDKLLIPPLSKQNRSTAEDVLKELMLTVPAYKELLSDILLYREYSKLLSTYTDPLIAAASSDGRIHTTFKQTGTATGRLSSVSPNLQNIPVRGEIGKLIRKAFVPAAGTLFVSMDYSQIELRILAHFSKDENLIHAFEAGADIHCITAMKIFNLTEEELTPDKRRLAKAVNFGILYGLSSYGLSRDVGVTPKEAKTFIDAYFALYSGVRRYITEMIRLTAQNGYCETLLGRKRFFPDITSRNSVIRQRAERAATNAPIQGSAADIIKIAMLRCDKLIKTSFEKVKICLQIHDELIFEVPKPLIEDFSLKAKFEMENAFKLAVPLVVNTSVGANWGELK